MSVSDENIEIDNIEAELTRLFNEGQKKGEIRGCLFNLIIYSQDLHRSIFLNEIVQTVIETFPCRIIFIECDPSSTEKRYLKVSAEQPIVKKEASIITCDRINIHCSSHFLNRVPYIVLPNFVPDLPIYLLWGQDPSLENEILPFLENYATRLIFDSDSSCDIRAFCRKMLSDQVFKKIPVTDMNWASLTSWRDILYQIFDSEEKIDLLQHCSQLTIQYNNKTSDVYQHTERRSIYLQGWLASQLNWNYMQSEYADHHLKITYDNSQGYTEVRLIGKNIPELTPGAIVNVEVQTANDIIYDFSRLNVQPFIKAHITMKDTCELPITLPLRHSKKGLLFMNEIFFVPCSPHYWNMLKAIEPIQVPC